MHWSVSEGIGSIGRDCCDDPVKTSVWKPEKTCIRARPVPGDIVSELAGRDERCWLTWTLCRSPSPAATQMFFCLGDMENKVVVSGWRKAGRKRVIV